MAWTVADLEAGDGEVVIAGDPAARDGAAEGLFGLALLALGLGASWVTGDAFDPAAGGGLAGMVLIGVVLFIRFVRSGLRVSRTGLVVRRTFSRRVTLRWSQVRSIAFVDGPLQAEWRILRIEAIDGRVLWVWRVRTSDGASRARRRVDEVEAGPPGWADDLAARLEELRRRANPTA